VELHERTLVGVRDAVASREASAEEAVRSALARIGRLNGSVNAFTQVFEEGALKRARGIDRALAKGEAVGVLAGVALALKDNICTDFGRTTCGSRMLEGYESPFTATAAQRLIDAGGVIVGKTNMDEFAMGSSTEHSCFGPTRNPWNPERVPGGSSGGSAAAVALRLVPGALGSDTGGSVRQPAALCGVVGFKPTYGLVSRWGLVAYASSLDQIGPIARTVADAEALFGVISGRDALDSTSVESPRGTGAPSGGGGCVGVVREARSEHNHAAVRDAVERAVAALQRAGVTVVDVELPRLSLGVPAYYLVACAECSSNLARLDGVRYGRRAELRAGEGLYELYARSRAEGFGEEVQRRIMLGTYALSAGYYDAYYGTAMRVRRLIRDDFERVFGAEGARPACDAVLMPTTLGPAFRIGEKSDDPWAMYLEDVYTVTANMAGLPAVSVPGGFAEEPGGVRLPVGVQLLGRAFSDLRLLRLARLIESDEALASPPERAV